jgi:hypothetical protein
LEDDAAVRGLKLEQQHMLMEDTSVPSTSSSLGVPESSRYVPPSTTTMSSTTSKQITDRRKPGVKRTRSSTTKNKSTSASALFIKVVFAAVLLLVALNATYLTKFAHDQAILNPSSFEDLSFLTSFTGEEQRRSALKQKPEKTLALLYPPGLLGGYRNQVLRFIAFVVHAQQNNFTQIHLPSLLWSTQLGGMEDGRKGSV